MKFLIFTLTLFSGFAGSQEVTADKMDSSAIYDPRLLNSESGLRKIIASITPELTTSFYYYDGDQSFGVFYDPNKKERALLVLSPDGRIDKFRFWKNEENIKVFIDHLKINFATENVSSGDLDKTKVYVQTIGIWISPPEGIVNFEILLSQRRGKFYLSGSRDESGQWRGQMNKSKEQKNIKKNKRARN